MPQGMETGSSGGGKQVPGLWAGWGEVAWRGWKGNPLPSGPGQGREDLGTLLVEHIKNGFNALKLFKMHIYTHIHMCHIQMCVCTQSSYRMAASPLYTCVSKQECTV